MARVAMSPKKKAVTILEDYANSIKAKGINFPKPKNEKRLALLSISWLEDEYRNDNEFFNRSSINNIPDTDKRFKAAQFLLRLETKQDDIMERSTVYSAYDLSGKKIMAMTNLRELVKRLNKYFDGNYHITQYSVEKELQAGKCGFDWGRLEVHKKESEI